MFRPAHFVEDDRATLFTLMRRYDFATLVTMAGDKPVATHLPLLIDAGRGANGTLLGHVSRANKHWRGFGDGPESLAIFQGPHAYVSPRWYATTPLVPTWNYAVVHAYGTPAIVDDADAKLAIIERLVTTQEAVMPEPWRVDEVPGDFREVQLSGIVAFEIEITRLEGKFKMSQDKQPADRAGVIAALEARDDPLGHDVARIMAAREDG